MEIYVYTTLHTCRMRHKVNFLKLSLTDLISEFSFSYTDCPSKAKEPSLSNYLPALGRRISSFIPFPLVLSK